MSQYTEVWNTYSGQNSKRPDALPPLHMKNTDQPGHWLTNAELSDMADSLLFEVRLKERLIYLYNTHVETNGLAMFEAITARFDEIKSKLDEPIMEELHAINGYIMQENAAGREPNLSVLRTSTDLRQEWGYPTAILFPAYSHRESHITWQYVNEIRDVVSKYVFLLESAREIESIKERIDKLPPATSAEPDTTYSLLPPFFESHEYQYFKGDVSEKRKFPIDYHGAKGGIYIDLLAAFLISEQVPVFNIDAQSEEILNGQAYLKTYMEGYKEGADSFKTKYTYPKEILYGPEAATIAETLHYQYAHSQHGEYGWNFCLKCIPKHISHKTVREYGVAAGNISQLHEMAEAERGFFDKYSVLECADTAPATLIPPVDNQQDRIKTPLATVKNLRQLTSNSFQSPALKTIVKSGHIPEHLPPLEQRIPDYQLALTLFDERYPDEVKADKWKKLRQGYSLTWNDFYNEFEQRIDTLVADKESRIAYLKRLFDKLYGGQMRYDRLMALSGFLESDEFKNLKSVIDADLWNDLDEIGYAVWQSAAYGMATDYLLERQLEIEGLPLSNGWRPSRKPIDPPPLTPPTPTPPPATDQPKTKAIYILPDARPALISDLIIYVDPLQHESLKALVNEGLEPDQPIIWLCEQAELGRVFYQRVKDKDKKKRQIRTAKTIIAKWIYRHFVRSEAETIKKLSESTILRVCFE